LPYSNRRIDVLLFGTNSYNQNSAVIIELKQWSRADRVDEDDLNVLVDGIEHLHPSQQSLAYSDSLSEIQSAIE